MCPSRTPTNPVKVPHFALLTILFTRTQSPLAAGEPQTVLRYEQDPSPPPSVFQRGRIDLSAMAHAYWSFSLNGGVPDIDYTMGALRVGRMLSDPRGNGIWRHNTELVLEALYAGVTDGAGDWLAGGNILIRRNFIGQDERVAWYLQAGAGLVANDVYRDLSQTLIGRATEISLLVGAGVRFQLSESWHAFLEVNCRHLSNADTRDRNTGLNSLGGGLGFGCAF